MPVLEICHLLIKPHLSPSSPLLFPALQRAKAQLASHVHDTHSLFFIDTHSPASIYIFGVWDSVAQHEAFLKSEMRGRILDAQEEFFAFGGCWHVELGGEGEGGEIRYEGVVGGDGGEVKRSVVLVGTKQRVDGAERKWEGVRGVLGEKVVGMSRVSIEGPRNPGAEAEMRKMGWLRVLDAPGENGDEEYVLLTGWPDEGSFHTAENEAKEKGGGVMDIEGAYKRVDTRLMVKMEKEVRDETVENLEIRVDWDEVK